MLNAPTPGPRSPFQVTVFYDANLGPFHLLAVGVFGLAVQDLVTNYDTPCGFDVASVAKGVCQRRGVGDLDILG
jgi:hypothetical protein